MKIGERYLWKWEGEIHWSNQVIEIIEIKENCKIIQALLIIESTDFTDHVGDIYPIYDSTNNITTYTISSRSKFTLLPNQNSNK